MGPETIEALNDCEKTVRKILTPLSLIGHAINKNGYLDKTFRKNQKALTECAERFVLLLSREPEIIKCMLDTVYYIIRTPHQDTSSFRYNIYSPVSVVCKTIKAFSEIPDFAIKYGIT